MIWLIQNFAGKPTRYKMLETQFGISARKWQNVCNRAQQPSIEMVAALASIYPFFLSWMVMGKAQTIMQLDPTEPGWFKTLLSSVEGATNAQTDILHRYADRLLEDFGIPTSSSDTSATNAARREKLAEALRESPKASPKVPGPTSKT